MPLLIAFILFLIFGELAWNEQYIGSISLLLSAIILWFVDNGPDLLTYSREIKRVKSKNALMWIEVKYWAIVLAIAGCIFLFNL